MKLEIEITEEEIKSAVERKVRTAIADQANLWGTDTLIKQKVREHWETAIDDLVVEGIANSSAIREKILAEIERKLRAQVTAAIREGAK